MPELKTMYRWSRYDDKITSRADVWETDQFICWEENGYRPGTKQKRRVQKNDSSERWFNSFEEAKNYGIERAMKNLNSAEDDVQRAIKRLKIAENVQPERR